MRIYGFIDGAYVRSLEMGTNSSPWVVPRLLIEHIVTAVSDAGPVGKALNRRNIQRVAVYDALSRTKPTPGLEEYLDHIELQALCEVRPGVVRERIGRRHREEQKGVDVLAAVDMLGGAFDDRYDAAVLVAGDADFVPVVDEVRRIGKIVVVAAAESSLALDLGRVADVRVALTGELPSWSADRFPQMQQPQGN